jgi:integrase
MISKENWVEWLQLKGLSEKSVHYYSFYFNKIDLEKLSPDSLLDFLKKNNNGVARAMVKNLLYFLRTSSDVSIETKEWVSSFEIPKLTGRKKKRVLKVLTKEQVHTLAKEIDSKRDSYMVLLTFYLGLRVSELLSLNLKSFDWKNGKVKIIGKGDKERILPLIPELQERIAEFINESVEKNPDFDLLFPVSIRRWQTILEKYSRKILDKSVNPHLLRHSCGSYLYNNGLGLKEIADFLGHSSIQTAQIYVHLDKKKFDSKILGAFK